ncbi:MAG: serine/threonine protein kinase [Lysobacteraceae bacterium]
MEFDDFKSAWQALDTRLQLDNTLNLELLRERRLDKTRSSLRPLFVGQLVQMLFGLGFILMAALLWSTKPDAPSVIVAGVIVHAYGVACIILAGIVLGGLGKLDYTAPVLEIQTRLARVRRAYILSGMVAGLPWWFMWVPILAVVCALGGVNLYANAPSLIWIGYGIGVAGLLATAWFHRCSRSAARPKLAKFMNDSVTGNSLRRAQSHIDELKRFELE